MIEARAANTADEIQAVHTAMRVFGALDGLCVYGYWNESRCVGGAWLNNFYPHDLVMEFYCHSPTIVKAISQSYSGMFRNRSRLTARIAIDNFKSLKMVRLLGFHRLYEDGGYVTVDLIPEKWRYHRRYPLELNNN